MKIAIFSTGTEIDSEIDQRFGRCNYFLIFDDETNNLEVFPNPSASTPSGSGIEAAKNLAKKGIKVVICGNIGLMHFKF